MDETNSNNEIDGGGIAKEEEQSGAASFCPTGAPADGGCGTASSFVAVTIGCGENFLQCANLAAESCRRRTGLPTVILKNDSLKRLGLARPHHLKFRLFDEVPEAETILYFDADTIFLRQFDVMRFAGREEFVGVGEIANDDNVIRESREIKIKPTDYFNSGLFILNRTHHAPLLRDAESYLGKIKTGFEDQTYLNASRSRRGTGQILLSKTFNHLRLELTNDSSEISVGHFRWIDSKPPEMVPGYFDWWLRKSSSRSVEIEGLTEELTTSRWDYERVGHDHRPMTFRPNHRVDVGSAGAEQFWEISNDGTGPILWISGVHHTTLYARHVGDGEWSGCWLRHERMPIRIKKL